MYRSPIYEPMPGFHGVPKEEIHSSPQQLDGQTDKADVTSDDGYGNFTIVGVNPNKTNVSVFS